MILLSGMSAECVSASDLLYFMSAIEKSEMSNSKKVSALVSACGELDTRSFNGAFAQTHPDLGDKFAEITWSVFRGVGFGPASFVGVGGTKEQDAFANELDLIRPVTSPVVRIQKVYELVARHQGNYDDGGGGSPYFLPFTMINRAAKTGIGGQCRDFALMLYWSLLQVARHESDQTGLGGLGPNSFSVSAIYGSGQYGDKKVAHEWVRVHVPGKNRTLNSFDLDSTWYRNTFTPIPRRLQGLSQTTLATAKTLCNARLRCWREQYLLGRTIDSRQCK